MRPLVDFTEPELAVLLQEMGRAVVRTGRAHGVGDVRFALLVSDMAGVMQYVANLDRVGMIASLREMADRLERRGGGVERVPFVGEREGQT